jgi:hypothetical protein
MIAQKFVRAVANGEIDLFALLFELLTETKSSYCLIGGMAVNAYAEPVVSLDVDVVVDAGKVEGFCARAKGRGLGIERFENSINLSSKASDLRVQIQTDTRYQAFIPRSRRKTLLGRRVRVADAADLLQGKIWAYLDETRRKSKRQKDLADIMRLVEADPSLTDRLPPQVRRMVG